jgi:hypothetical protein
MGLVALRARERRSWGIGSHGYCCEQISNFRVVQTYQVAVVLMGPSHCCSLKKMQVIEMVHHSNIRKEDSREPRAHIGVDWAASSMIEVGTNSATRVSMGQPKLVREQLQQTCVVDARQHMIASGLCSCCCRSLGGSRSCPGFRRGSPVATAHATIDRHGSVEAHSVLARVF